MARIGLASLGFMLARGLSDKQRKGRGKGLTGGVDEACLSVASREGTDASAFNTKWWVPCGAPMVECEHSVLGQASAT